MNLVLVHGIFSATSTAALREAGARRAEVVAEHGKKIGARDYEWVDGRKRALANRLLRAVRGTAPAVDAVEIFEVDEVRLRDSLASDSGRAWWKMMASCEADGFDGRRSFALIGAPLLLLEGTKAGQRVLWFGNGLDHLTRAEFIAHYTGRHGPLVAGHAGVIGLKRYRQVPMEQDELADSLRSLGLGQAPPPSVFAELVMGAPPLNLSSLRARRAATREIEADEKRHIGFSRSMLLLAGQPAEIEYPP